MAASFPCLPAAVLLDERNKIMKIALMGTGNAPICRAFVHLCASDLESQGIDIGVVVLDQQREKQNNPVRHALRVAGRQARIRGVSMLSQFFNILVYKAFYAMGTSKFQPDFPEIAEDVHCVKVTTLNSSEAIQAVKDSGCDLVCLMGTRILTRKTIDALSVEILNIHSSDPKFVRGGPPTFWEILAGRSEIALTIHRVKVQVDTGEILKQRTVPICYCGGLGVTSRETMSRAWSGIAQLFAETIKNIAQKSVQSTSFKPGPLRVTPNVWETIRADRICRKKHNTEMKINVCVEN